LRCSCWKPFADMVRLMSVRPYPKDVQLRRTKRKTDWTGFSIPKIGVKLDDRSYRLLKKRIIGIVGQQCEIPSCLETDLELLQLHHRKSRGACRMDTFENCYLVCFRCHRQIEGRHLKPDWKYIDKRRHRLCKSFEKSSFSL